MERAGLSVEWYVYRHRTEDEVLPWDHLDAGLHKDFLWTDWMDALEEVGLPDCRWTPCYDCGACTGYGIEHVVASGLAAGRRVPGHPRAPPTGHRCSGTAGNEPMRVRSAIHQERTDPVHFPP